MSLKIEFPLKTKNPVNGSRGMLVRRPNGKVINIHAKEAARVRARTHLAFLISGAKKPGPLFVVRLTRISPGTLDDDNLRPTLKAVRDAVANWLGVDDGGPLVRWEYQQGKGDARVRIEIEQPLRTPTTLGELVMAWGEAGRAAIETEDYIEKNKADEIRRFLLDKPSALPGGDE